MIEAQICAGIALGVLAVWAAYAYLASKTTIMEMVKAECVEISRANTSLMNFAKKKRGD